MAGYRDPPPKKRSFLYDVVYLLGKKWIEEIWALTICRWILKHLQQTAFDKIVTNWEMDATAPFTVMFSTLLITLLFEELNSLSGWINSGFNGILKGKVVP